MALGSPVYATSGHILFDREPQGRGVWALPFSLDRLEVSGEPFPVAPLGINPSVAGSTLVYAPVVPSILSEIVEVDRKGQVVRDDRRSPPGSVPVAGARLVGVSAIPMTGDRKPFAVVPRQTLTVDYPRFSPDGRWLTYGSNESGRNEIYLVSFPDGERRIQISNAGGSFPKWSRGGREILYTAFDSRVMSVGIESGPRATRAPRVDVPRPLFPLPEGASAIWDVSADGERFLVNVPVLKSSSVPLSLVVNWVASLER